MSLEENLAKMYFKERNSMMDQIGSTIGAIMREGEFPFPEQELRKSATGEKERNALDNYMRAKRDAPQIIDSILDDLESGKRRPHISYEEPDQSPLTGYEAEILREKWNCGMDMPGSVHRPLGLRYFSDWYMTIYLGNYSDFIKMVDNFTEMGLKKQLNKRESMIQLSAIFLPIIGARNLWREGIEDKDLRGMRIVFNKVERKHMQILDKLIQLGADLNSHDVAGFTPLHHCLTCTSNDHTFAMALKLLQHGADPNSKNRFGCTALMTSVMANNLPAIKLLMDNNADPYIKDNTGTSAYEIGVRFPSVNEHLRSRDNRFIKKEREEAKKKSYKKCGKCARDAEKRCTGCFLQWYCSGECQKSDWKVHRDACKQVRAEYQEVTVEDCSYMNFHHKTGKVHTSATTTNNKPKASNFVVKIQVNLELANVTCPMMCYNRERDVEFMISTGTEFGKQLRKIIIDKDRRKLYKGYFYCITKDEKYYINPSPLPWEKW